MDRARDSNFFVFYKELSDLGQIFKNVFEGVQIFDRVIQILARFFQQSLAVRFLDDECRFGFLSNFCSIGRGTFCSLVYKFDGLCVSLNKPLSCYSSYNSQRFYEIWFFYNPKHCIKWNHEKKSGKIRIPGRNRTFFIWLRDFLPETFRFAETFSLLWKQQRRVPLCQLPLYWLQIIMDYRTRISHRGA